MIHEELCWLTSEHIPYPQGHCFYQQNQTFLAWTSKAGKSSMFFFPGGWVLRRKLYFLIVSKKCHFRKHTNSSGIISSVDRPLWSGLFSSGVSRLLSHLPWLDCDLTTLQLKLLTPQPSLNYLVQKKYPICDLFHKLSPSQFDRGRRQRCYRIMDWTWQGILSMNIEVSHNEQSRGLQYHIWQYFCQLIKCTY